MSAPRPLGVDAASRLDPVPILVERESEWDCEELFDAAFARHEPALTHPTDWEHSSDDGRVVDFER